MTEWKKTVKYPDSWKSLDCWMLVVKFIYKKKSMRKRSNDVSFDITFGSTSDSKIILK